MIIRDTTLTEPLHAWLLSAADDGRVLRVRQHGPDIHVDALVGLDRGLARVDLTETETLEVTALLAAHAAEPFTTCPKDQP